MPATTRSRKSRKRKQPDSFNDDLPKPKTKRRKLVHRSKTRIPIHSNHKSQSEEPKLSNPAPDPFTHTTVPSVSFNIGNRHQTKPPKKHGTTRRYSQYPYRKDEPKDIKQDTSEDDAVSVSTSESTHNTPLRPKHTAIRSQPSTPVRGITMDKKPELSQSAKKSRGYKAYTRHSNTVLSPVPPHNITSSLCDKLTIKSAYSSPHREPFASPPTALTKHRRKTIPNLFSSQDSISFSPPYAPSAVKRTIIPTNKLTPTKTRLYLPSAPSPVKTCYSPSCDGEGETHVIPVAATPLRRSAVVIKKQKSKYPRTQVKHGYNILPSTFLFSLIGFIVGFIVCISVYCENELNVRDPKPTTKAFATLDTTDVNTLCTCDINTNTASRLCRPCMDQYYAMEAECKQCNEENTRLKGERDKMETERAILGGNCERNKKELNRLRQEARQLRDGKEDGTRCDEYRKEVGNLEHELGECHVEWGSCEQLGRQKDKLDEKRVEEIEKQKNKFSLCNDQLKRYKADIKKRNRK